MRLFAAPVYSRSRRTQTTPSSSFAFVTFLSQHDGIRVLVTCPYRCAQRVLPFRRTPSSPRCSEAKILTTPRGKLLAWVIAVPGLTGLKNVPKPFQPCTREKQVLAQEHCVFRCRRFGRTRLLARGDSGRAGRATFGGGRLRPTELTEPRAGGLRVLPTASSF